jgi:undecaprenyl-diphosphatase
MDSNTLDVILLGIVEGLTEFIPVSSTGHLVLASELLGFTGDVGPTFNVVIQLGAILAVVVAYWRRFWDVLVGLPRERGAQVFTANVFLGVLPSLVIGAFAYGAVKAMLESPMTVAVALIVGGVAILAIERLVKTAKFDSVETMPWRTSLGVGIVQCLSLIPGVSRSGATIMGALVLGVDRKTAAEFSFFVAVPTMVAATSYELYKNHASLSFGDLEAIALGFGVSFIVALAVIKGFIAVVGRYGFAPFAWYRIVAGSAAMIWLLIR